MKNRNKETIKRRNSGRGITLIALVITIVVLIILATISIQAVFSDGGIIKQAERAKDEQANATKHEESGMDQLANYLNEKAGENKQSDNLKVEYTITEGTNLWSSKITFHITFGEEANFTLEQKRKIASFLFDYSTFDEFKQYIEKIAEKTYEEVLQEWGSEDNFLNHVMAIGNPFMNFNKIEEIENLGIKVAKIQTPYDTTLYVSSLNENVECSVMKNGIYEFIIQSGNSTIKQEIEIDNVRDYSTQEPFNIRIEGDSKLLYSVDDSEEWNVLTSDTNFQCNSTVSFKFNPESEAAYNGYSAYGIIMDEDYYELFSDPSEWDTWYGDQGLIAGLAKYMGYSCRQLYGHLCFENNSTGNFNSSISYGDYANFIDELIAGNETKDEIKAKYPKSLMERDILLSIPVGGLQIGEDPICTVNITEDTNMHFYFYSEW